MFDSLSLPTHVLIHLLPSLSLRSFAAKGCDECDIKRRVPIACTEHRHPQPRPPPPWLPPKSDQGLQQGGAFVFEGEELLFQHYDPSTGAHVDLDTVLKVALTA